MQVDFSKTKDGLIPAIIQDYTGSQVLMLGYMNEEALTKTRKEGKVTFFSRSKKRLWTKGEESGNFLIVREQHIDCDNDTILIKVDPAGPTCHKGTVSCFASDVSTGFLSKLERTINQRIDENEKQSYTNKLYKEGLKKIAQKVGEEAVELSLEAVNGDDESFENEAADLMYHFLVLLRAREIPLSDIEEVLKSRSAEDHK